MTDYLKSRILVCIFMKKIKFWSEKYTLDLHNFDIRIFLWRKYTLKFGISDNRSLYRGPYSKILGESCDDIF